MCKKKIKIEQFKFKSLIFRSAYSGAIYLWNGKEVICINEPTDGSYVSDRTLGRIMKGFKDIDFETIMNGKETYFLKNEFSDQYEIIKKINYIENNGVKQYVIIDEYPTIELKDVEIIQKGKSFSVPLDNFITKKFLLENGFDEKNMVSWFGNGYDYLITPENGGSKTSQQDFVLSKRDNNLIVRFTDFSYKKNNKIVKKSSISFHYGDWYPKCDNIIPVFCLGNTYKIHDLLLAHKLIMGEELKINK